jgi:parallel beta-helix repeat protein
MKRATTTSVFAVALCLWLLPSVATAETKKRTCGGNPGQTLQHFLDELNPGDTLIVSGTCNENVVIGENRRNLTIDGQGTATIDGSGNSSAAAVQVRGRGVIITGFRIIGGRHGIQFSRGGTGTVERSLISGASTHGVVINDNSFARVVASTIEQNGVHGICVCEHASAEIGFRGDFSTQGSANTIRSNGNSGITVADSSYAEIESNVVYGNVNAGISINGSSSARIGAESGPAGTFAGGNTVELNGNRGIVVNRSSSARVVQNTIRNNTGGGVGVFKASHADIAANDIGGNGGNGISVTGNSGVNLGNDSGSLVDDQPNATLSLNSGFGISCGTNSTADGRQGSLNGSLGAQNFAGSCTNSLLP